MKEVCNRYADKMRPESLVHEHVPKHRDSFLYYPVKTFAFCQNPGVATKGVHTFLYSGEIGAPAAGVSQSGFTQRFPEILKWIKQAIVVRHPLERLVSVYRFDCKI